MGSSNFHLDKRASPPLAFEDLTAEKKMIIIRYKECLKNHAAAIGGNATDGCGEFMPSGEEGTLEALKCSACNCHRNFHRKAIQSTADCPSSHQNGLILAHLSPTNYKSGSVTPSDHSEGKDININEDVENNPTEEAQVMMRKRFRTKFTQEQKDKMLGFAEKAGWRIQKLEDSVVESFCQEIGIKRRVLKVWMHNNKNTFAKRSIKPLQLQ